VALNRALPNALARQGWDVTVVAPEFFPGDLRPIALEVEADGPAKIAPVRLRASSRPHAMTWGGDLRRLLDEDWDVVHAWEEPYVPAGAQVARWHRSGRLVFATFQNIAKRYPPPFNWVERYSMARADAWIAFGVTVERALRSKPMYARLPHQVIAPAIDLARFSPDAPARAAARDTLGFSPADTVVGFAGRFVPEKGLSTLTAALDRAVGPWKALFVGGGALQLELERWARPYGNRVRIVSDATHTRMPWYLNAMDVLAVPSRTTGRWREQFGRVIVEGMACGAAVVGSDSGEIPYVIGDAGVVLPERDDAAWAEGLATLIADPARRAELATRGRARARDFDAETAAGRHASFFERLLRTP
jgi:glycosyltransferase involved in cell wall biosynthesis